MAQNPQQARLIRTAREVNDGKPHWVVDQVKAAVADCPAATDKRASEVKIACFGLAFAEYRRSARKPGDGDRAKYRPLAQRRNPGRRTEYPSVAEKLDGLCTLAKLDAALTAADVLVMLVDHDEFKAIPGDAVHQRYVVDTKGVWR